MIAASLDCRHHLCEPDMKLVWPSAKLLQAAAGASARACEHLTSNVLPLLLEQFHKHSQVRATDETWVLEVPFLERLIL